MLYHFKEGDMNDNLTVRAIFDKIGIGRTSILVFVLMACSIFFDGFDYMLVAYTMPQISAEWGLDAVATGSLSSWSMLGLVIGGACGGILADKVGRKKVLWVSALAFSILTTLIYVVPNYPAFAACRVLAGLALGSLSPVSIAMVSEAMPTKRVPFFVAATTSFMPIGYTMASVAAMAIIPAAGWRGVYLVSAIGIVLAIVLVFALPESPKWLMRKGRKEEAYQVMQKFIASSKESEVFHNLSPEMLINEPVPATISSEKTGFIGLFNGKTMILGTIGIWLIYFCSSWGSCGINTWMPSLLMEKGFDMNLSYSINMTQTILGVISNYIAGYLAVKLTVKKASISMFAASGVAMILLALIPGGTAVMFALVGFMGLALGGVPASTNGLCTAIYPTSCRGTGVSFMQAIGRAAGIIAPLVCGALIDAGVDFTGVILSFVVPMVCGVAFILIFMKRDADGNKM